MLIDARMLGSMDADRRREIVRILRVMLRRLQHDIQRAEVRLSALGERRVCRLRVCFIGDELFAMEQAGDSLWEAFLAAAESLRAVIASRRGSAFRRRRRPHVRPLLGRREAFQASREQQRTRHSVARRARRRRGNHTGHRVLVALPPLAYPRIFPERSRLLQAVLGSDLHVLKVLRGLPSNATGSASQWLDGERLLRAQRETLAWFEAMLGAGPPATHVRVRIGDFVSEVAAQAAAVDAAMIILPETEERMGSAAAALARGTFRPVLVARPLASGNVLLAALDADDEQHPVLEAAELLAAELGSDVIAVYNDDATANGSDTAPGRPDRTDPETVLAPQHAGVGQGYGATMLLTREGDSARVFVREARARDVDTILVGARPPSLFERLQGQDVVADVVDDADRSVLIMPLASPDYVEDFGAACVVH